MNKRNLGKSGVEVSAMGLGCMSIAGTPWTWVDGSPVEIGTCSEEDAIKMLHKALDLGITFFDTADLYGCGRSEERIGKAFSGKRDNIVIASKFAYRFKESERRILSKGEAQFQEGVGYSIEPEYIRLCCEDSLRRLNTDYIDLYQLHHAGARIQEEHYAILEELVSEGKIRWYGWSSDHPEDAERMSTWKHCTAIQQEFNIFNGNLDTLAVCEKNNLASINRTCLAAGLLSGKINSLTDSSNGGRTRDWDLEQGREGAWLRKLEAIREILTSEGRTLVQGALCWLWGKSDATIPIPGFRTTEQLVENCGALEHAPLTVKQLEEIEDIKRGEKL